MEKIDALYEIDEDILTKIALAAAAGIVAAAGGKKIYDKYTAEQMLNKYTKNLQENPKYRNDELVSDILLNILDANKLSHR